MEPAWMRLQYHKQNYGAFWPAVLVSEAALSKMRDIEILYAGFPSAFRRTLIQVLDGNATTSASEPRILVQEVHPWDGVPPGIKLSYTIVDDSLLICDLWLPPQPQLFEVEALQPTKPKRRK